MTALLLLAGATLPASADVLDPLHGYCGGAGQCADNGTNSPTSINPPVNFGFTISPGPATGNLLIDILVPGNLQTPGASYGITGTFSGTATLFSATDWTSGNLDTFLGISASPTNPIGAYLPSTQALDPGALGFSVYQLNAGTRTLQDASNPNVNPLLNLTSSLPIGSYIVAFLNEGTTAAPDWLATANSGAIFETSGPPKVPLPGALPLFATGLVGLGLLGRRKRKAVAP
jgi:hypothetical protein